jgi:DNA end-binding protein Ku
VAPRPYWKGYLKLSLVTCAVSLTSATSERDKVRFHTLNRETGNRIKSRYTDAESGKPVKDEDQVRGYELSDGRQLVIEDEEIEAVGLESTRTIDIGEFVPARTIDWIWYDTPYYLTPDDEIALEAFSVIREAMKVTKTVGISRLVLSRRERAVMLEPRGKGIVLWTLRYGDEVRDPDLVFGNMAEQKPEAKTLALVEKLIGDMVRPWDPSVVQDPVQDSIKAIIAAKEGKRPKRTARTARAEAEPASNVVSIIDALKRSIKQESARKKNA